MQLHPREYFTIARGLEDHTDSTTYYVRAVIRNARTDALIDTVNLEDKGDGHRFSKEWQVPADTSGAGFYLLITTSVYTDSGYTTKSSLYGDKYDTYLVHERKTTSGGGYVDIDYRKIQKMIQDEIAKLPRVDDINFPKVEIPEFPEIPKVDHQPVLQAIAKAIEEIKREIRKIHFPEIPQPEKVDLSPVMHMISEIDVTTTKENTDKIINLLKEVNERIDEFNQTEGALSKLQELNKRFVELGKLQEQYNNIQLPIPIPKNDSGSSQKLFKNFR